MSITIDVPDGIVRDLQTQSGDVARMAKDALAMEGYRTGMLSIGQVASMLGVGVIAAQTWLAQHGIPLNYAAADFQADCQTVSRLLPEATG